MKTVNKLRRGAAANLHLSAIVVAALFWILDSAVDVYVFGSGTFQESLLVPGLVELWMRSLVVALLVGFGFFAQRVVARIKRAEEAVRQAQKMEAVGRLAGGVAHDFNNLLTVILADADLIALDLPPDSEYLQELVQALRDAARRGATLIKQLLALSSPGKLSPRPVDVGRLADDLATTLRRLLPATIDVQIITDDRVPLVYADPSALEQVVLNLATNARDAMPRGGRLRIEVRSRDPQEGTSRGEYVCLSVSDTGVGVDANTRRRMFEPFFTTKPPGAGNGLGLSVVYGLVTEHHGVMDVNSEVGMGTTVDVFLPVAGEGAAVVVPDEVELPAVGGSETILLVDDDESLGRVTQRALERYGYSLLRASDGREALETFRTHDTEIALVISDVVMPNMSGPDLYKAILRQAPATKFMFVSGYAPEYLQAKMDLHPTVPFLAKPWTVVDLLARLREVLDGDDQVPMP